VFDETRRFHYIDQESFKEHEHFPKEDVVMSKSKDVRKDSKKKPSKTAKEKKEAKKLKKAAKAGL